MKFIKKIRKSSHLKAKAAYEGVKEIITATELELRGGGPFTGALNAWDTTKTAAQGVNIIAESTLGTQALGDAIAEWKKGHYFCCVCSGVACGCFFTGAIACAVPGGYGVWKVASTSGCYAKAVTGVCRKITAGKGI